MLDNLLTESELVDQYEVLVKWFEYGSRNYIESVIGLELTRKHMKGLKSLPHYNLHLQDVNQYYMVFKKSMGNDMPIIEVPNYDEVQAI